MGPMTMNEEELRKQELIDAAENVAMSGGTGPHAAERLKADPILQAAVAEVDRLNPNANGRNCPYHKDSPEYCLQCGGHEHLCTLSE